MMKELVNIITELEFVDCDDNPFLDTNKEYEGFCPPIPNVGEVAFIGGDAEYVIIKERKFFYYKGKAGIDIKIQFICECCRG